MDNMIRNVKDTGHKSEQIDIATSNIVDSLLEKIILGEVLDFKRAVKFATLDEKAELEDVRLHESVEGFDIDVFGQKFKPPVCACPFCDQIMGACRLSVHFVKCKARKGNRTSQRETKGRKIYSEAISEDDNNDDYDWVAGPKQSKVARKKRDRNESKSSKAQNKHSPVKDVAVVLDANIFEQLQQVGETVDGNGLALQPKKIANERHRRKQRKMR